MKAALLLLLISFSAMADYSKEKAAIEKFEKTEFLNSENYPPTKPGNVPEINRAFYDKLVAEPTSMKYFLFLSNKYRLINLYKSDKAFASSLNNKFDGKAMTKDNWEKVMKVLGSKILSESNTEHKRVMASPEAAGAYFKQNVELIKKTSFK